MADKQKELDKCNKLRESAEEKIIKLENDIKNIKADKLWNYLSFLAGVLFLIFVLYMDIDGSAISVGVAGGKFEGNGLYILSFVIMFGNRLINALTKFISGISFTRGNNEQK